MGVMDRLAERWAQRESGLERVTHTASIVIRATPAEVYAFLLDPESMRVTVANAVNSFRVPGTPVGAIGEQICIITRQGRGHGVALWETTDLIAEREIRQSLLNHGTPWREHLLIEEYGPAAVKLTDTHEGDIALGSREQVLAHLNSSVSASLDRIRVALESRLIGEQDPRRRPKPPRQLRG